MDKKEFVEMLEKLSDVEVLDLKNMIIKYKDYREEKRELSRNLEKYKGQYEKHKNKFLGIEEKKGEK